MQSESASMTSSIFYYFAYGSNLLSHRLHLYNPSAKFIGVGRLVNHRLIFCLHESISSWGRGSAVASIEPRPNDDVFGAVWSIAEADKLRLDAQECVPWLYRPVNIAVLLQNQNSSLNCRSYIMLSHAPGLPSPFYLDIILRGAVQSGLPSDYVDKLRRFKYNEYLGECRVYDECVSHMSPDEKLKFELLLLRKYYQSKV
ncbi:hypothetical protein Aperf_G00000053749 [Anoplocephala perfoliata]